MILLATHAVLSQDYGATTSLTPLCGATVDVSPTEGTPTCSACLRRLTSLRNVR